MTGNVSHVQRRGYTYVVARDSRGRFTRFTRITRATQSRIMAEPSEAFGTKHISYYGTARSSEGIYKARVDAYGKGKDLYYLIRTLKGGHVPRRRYRHIRGRVDRIENNFFDCFTEGEWTDDEIES